MVLSLDIFPNKKRSIKVIIFLRKFSELLCIFCYYFASVGALSHSFFIAQHFYSLYSRRSVDLLGSQIALISVLLMKDKSWELGNIFSVYFYKRPSNRLLFLMAHCAAIRLNTCLQLLNRKKPAGEIY